MRSALIIIAMILLAITLYYGVVFDGQLPDHRMLRGKNDLVLHFCAFAALTIPVRMLWTGKFPIGLLALLAGAIEAIQIFQPDRTAAFDDLFASLLGIFTGVFIFAILQRSLIRIFNTNQK